MKMVKEITIKSALHHHDKTFATNWDLNIYRGCSHMCKYCFAQYSHKYLNDGDDSGFFDDVFVKTNVAEVLDKELSKKSWKGGYINICGVTDCYQPLEEKYKLMRKVLEVLIKHKNPVFILTKSPLILRDYDLIEELSKVAYVEIATTITTLNEEIRQKLEPNTFSSANRLNMIKEFNKLNCYTSIMYMPIIPYLTDNTKDIEAMFREAKNANVDNIYTSPLNLRGNVKKNFYAFLNTDFPEAYEKIIKLYKGAYVSKEYNEKLKKFLSNMRRKYKIYPKPKKEIPDYWGIKNKPKKDNEQLDLW